jgi:hypothetical protein
MSLERGFKAWSERVAQSLREDLKLTPEAPMPARLLAGHLDIILMTPSQIDDLPADILRQLAVVDPTGWHALSFEIQGVRTIIYNDRSSARRQSSDISHELAHIIRAHEPSQLLFSETNDFAMRSYDPKQEDEANWLGWALLLPRPALIRCMDQRMSNDAIAAEYEVSEQLVEFRKRMTGVSKQVQMRRGPRT